MTIESTSRPAARITDLDALRGLAALAVVLFHYTSRYNQFFPQAPAPPFSMPWGHYGVQLFFGISGFVIFMTLDRTRHLADFALSRFSRLYPAYWAAMILTALVVHAAGQSNLRQGAGTFLVNLSMLQNFLGVPSVDGVYWTLSVELAFYGLMAALWALGLLRRIEFVLFGWLGLRWFWTFAPRLFGFEPSWLLGTLLIQEFIPYFAVGIAAYRLRSGQAGTRLTGLVIASSLVTIAACDGLEQLLVGSISTAALLLVALERAQFLSARPLVWLGAISYSLYLLHQFIGFTALNLLERSGLPSSAAIGLTIAGVLILSAAVTFLVERPALRAIRRWYRTRGERRDAQSAARKGPAAAGLE